MDRLGGVTRRKALLALAAVIVAGGFAVALLGNGGRFTSPEGLSYLPIPAGGAQSLASSNFAAGASGGSGTPPDETYVISQSETASTSTSAGGGPSATPSNVTQGSPGGYIELSTSLAISAPSPQGTASAVSALAYSVGGYVAYQSTYNTSAYVVVRVPASDYQTVLAQVAAMGAFVSLTTNSNDVTVQYTDLNASLVSLQAEQGSLLRLLNESSSINSTLAIESQLQQVNQQINEVESQILQTRTLVVFATIDVTVSQASAPSPLSMVLRVTPDNGTAPLSVSFDAIVKGGTQPYVVNYNFGDGYSDQGQVLVHTYYQPGTYKVLVSVTDENGSVVQKGATVTVVPANVRSGLSAVMGTVGGLFVGVVEGMVEVAVVVLPIAAVGAAIFIPLQRRGRSQKQVRQNQ